VDLNGDGETGWWEGICRPAKPSTTEQVDQEVSEEWKVYVRHGISLAPDPTGIGILQSTTQMRQHLQEEVAFIKQMLSSICKVHETVISEIIYQNGEYRFSTSSMLILRKELKLQLQPQNLQLFASFCCVSGLPDKGTLTSSPVEESPKISSEGFKVVYQKAEVPETHTGRQPGNTGQKRCCNTVEASDYQ